MKAASLSLSLSLWLEEVHTLIYAFLANVDTVDLQLPRSVGAVTTQKVTQFRRFYWVLSLSLCQNGETLACLETLPWYWASNLGARPSSFWVVPTGKSR